MKEIVLYYSYTGKCRKFAEGLAKEREAELCEVKEVKRRGTLNAYAVGSVQAVGGKKPKIEPIKADLAACDKITLVAPIWAGSPAPAINSVADLLPGGKGVEIYLLSMNGGGSCEKLRQIIESRGCKVEKIENIRA